MESQTPDGNAAPRPGLHDFRARLAGHIGVVDNDSPHAGGEGGVERRHEIAQTAAGIITIQARISTGGKGLSKRRLAGARQPHDEDHVGVLSERRRRTAWRRSAAIGRRKALVEGLPIFVAQLDSMRTADRSSGLDTRHPWQGHDDRREIEEPGQGNLERRGIMGSRDLLQHRIGGRSRPRATTPSGR